MRPDFENSWSKGSKIIHSMEKTTLSIDVPESLIQQFRQRQISDKQIEAIVLAALEIWLAQEPTSSGTFGESAVPFVRRLIAQNRTLFETLAQR